MEVSTVAMWARIETFIELAFKTIFVANKFNLYEESGGDSMLGFIILSLACYFLVYTIIVTENSQTIANSFFELLEKLQSRPIACPQEIPPAEGPQINRKKIRLAKPATH